MVGWHWHRLSIPGPTTAAPDTWGWLCSFVTLPCTTHVSIPSFTYITCQSITQQHLSLSKRKSSSNNCPMQYPGRLALIISPNYPLPPPSPDLTPSNSPLLLLLIHPQPFFNTTFVHGLLIILHTRQVTYIGGESNRNCWIWRNEKFSLCPNISISWR